MSDELKPCKRCGATTNGALGMCDPCWELSRHLYNITPADVPEAVKRGIQAEALESFKASGNAMRTPNPIHNWDDFQSGVESCIALMKEEAAKLRGDNL